MVPGLPECHAEWLERTRWDLAEDTKWQQLLQQLDQQLGGFITAEARWRTQLS